MNLPGYKPDIKLAERLVNFQLEAAPLARGYRRDPDYAPQYYAALADAWEAGRLCPVINTNLSKEETDNAI